MIYCATGHRDIQKPISCKNKLKEDLPLLDIELMIIGCAKGFDTLVGWTCVLLNIPFDMYLPFPNSYYDKSLKPYARNFIVISDTYSYEAYFTRDKKMVDDSNRVLAWYDGRLHGGTFYTVKYARNSNKDVLNLYEQL